MQKDKTNDISKVAQKGEIYNICDIGQSLNKTAKTMHQAYIMKHFPRVPKYFNKTTLFNEIKKTPKENI